MRREAPGCLQAQLQLDAKELEAKVPPKLGAPVLQTTPSKLCEDALLRFQTCPREQGGIGHPHSSLGAAHSCEHIPSRLVHHK